MLHDGETGDAADVGPREWVLLAAADGTRDLEGILLAASREGVRVDPGALVALLASVDEAGLLEDGPRRAADSVACADPGASGANAPSSDDPRSIEALPGYAFRCDGAGVCCRLYSSIVFSPVEAARARSVLPLVLDAGDRHEHAFTPERGAGPCAGSAVALVEGGCAYLEGTLCGLHRAAGASAKPHGCNAFPLSLVDDGVRIRASVYVECPCVLASAHVEGGEPLVPAAARTRADLDPANRIDTLPDSIAMTIRARLPRADYVRWSDAAIAAFRAARAPDAAPPDAALVAWALADALDAGDASAEGAAAAVRSRATAGDLAGAWMVALERAARQRLAGSGWRSDRDLTRRGTSVLAGTATLLGDPDVRAAIVAGAGVAPADESLYLDAALFGHQVVDVPVAGGLRARAVAIWIARAFPIAASALYPEIAERGFERPLALVEALMRGHGLRRALVGEIGAT